MRLLNARLLRSSVTHCFVAHEPFWISCFCVLCKQAFLPYLPECAAIHVNVAGLLHGTMTLSWYDKGVHHPRTSNRLRRAVILDGAGEAPEETLQNMRAGTITGTREAHSTLPRTLNVRTAQKTRRRRWYRGTRRNPAPEVNGR